MTNNELIANLHNLETWRKQVRDTRTLISKMAKLIKELEGKVEKLDGVALVYKGVALNVWKEGAHTYICTMGTDVPHRAADIQPSGSGWALSVVYHQRKNRHYSPLDNHFDSLEVVTLAAKEWCACGTLPEGANG